VLSREVMNNWVCCLKSKLRELKILSPKENIYTKQPIMKPMLMTRNPRDPLPDCPPTQERVIPGLELTQSNINVVSHRDINRAEQHIQIVSTHSTESSRIESLVQSLNIQSSTVEENPVEDDSFAAITIPVFNFATSNTSSQNLINLLSNPLMRHHAANSSDINFANNFNTIGSQDDDDEEEEEEEEEEDEDDEDHINITANNILPTSLNIEYIPELSESQDNVTIIPVEESVKPRIPLARKFDESKVTKIKIEVEYSNDSCSKPCEEAKNANLANAVRHQHHHHHHHNHQSPTTSSSNNYSESEEKCINNKVSSAKSHHNTPKKSLSSSVMSSNTPKSTPIHEKRKLSLREQQVLHLRHEINNEIRFKLRKKDCVDGIAFVQCNDEIWIAGFKPNPQLYVFHVGDQLLAINNIANIKSPADAHKFMKMCAGLFVEVTIRRLPLAGIYIIKRDFEGQCLGLIRDGASVLEIIPNSVASRASIPSRPPSTLQGADDSIFWIITEINFRPLSLLSNKKYDETDLLLNGASLETSLLLQPSNFIAKIKKELKAMKNYRDYTLQ
jgi:hypothetical protein